MRNENRAFFQNWICMTKSAMAPISMPKILGKIEKWKKCLIFICALKENKAKKLERLFELPSTVGTSFCRHPYDGKCSKKKKNLIRSAYFLAPPERGSCWSPAWSSAWAPASTPRPGRTCPRSPRWKTARSTSRCCRSSRPWASWWDRPFRPPSPPSVTATCRPSPPSCSTCTRPPGGLAPFRGPSPRYSSCPGSSSSIRTRGERRRTPSRRRNIWTEWKKWRGKRNGRKSGKKFNLWELH